MNSLFIQPKSQILLRQNVFILKDFILIQLLSTANAKDINIDYILEIALFIFKVSWICSVEVGKETSKKIRGFEPGQGRMFFK